MTALLGRIACWWTKKHSWGRPFLRTFADQSFEYRKQCKRCLLVKSVKRRKGKGAQ